MTFLFTSSLSKRPHSLYSRLTSSRLDLVKHNGSVTAEHGIVVAKVNYTTRCKTDVKIRLMQSIKNGIDPRIVPSVL
ncbi:hypothetical protein BDC45DRAFT_565964 [Circinella umbellata]|nr:hypothetical protein BDC45DRAFT_565964 [Circinella umbellata]